jgi:hypothetical protein
VEEVGETASQVVLGLALQFKVPPLLLMVTVWGAGLVAPWVAVKESAAGLAPRVGAATTVKVTPTACDVAPLAATVIVLV